MKTTTQLTAVRSAFTALFAALICVGCVVSIPVPGTTVPIAVQNLFAILAGLILGGIQGAGAVGLFIVLGGIGIPVFSGARGGFGVLFGPTGGYIWGYFFGALVAGLIVGKPSIQEKKFKLSMWIKIAVASFIGFLIVYVPGIPWFMFQMAKKGSPVTFQKALALTFTPYIAGDLLKWVVSIPLAAVLRPVAARFLYPADEKEEAELIEQLKKTKEHESNRS